MVLLTGCVMGGSEIPVHVCPPVVAYSQTALGHAAAELEALPAGAVLTGMFSDYAVMRDQARACADR